MHPLYHQATRFIGQPVMVHAYGQVHYGILHSVNAKGCYLQKMSGAGHASSTEEPNAELVFWPLFFLPWLAIAAFSPWWGW